MIYRVIIFAFLLGFPAVASKGAGDPPDCFTSLDGLEACLHPDTTTELWNAVLAQRWRMVCDHGGNPRRLVDEMRTTHVCQVRMDDEVDLLELALPAAHPTFWLTVSDPIARGNYRDWLRAVLPPRLGAGRTVGIVVPREVVARDRAGLVEFLAHLQRLGTQRELRFIVRMK